MQFPLALNRFQVDALVPKLSIAGPPRANKIKRLAVINPESTKSPSVNMPSVKAAEVLLGRTQLLGI